jgi:hypothetical protein
MPGRPSHVLATGGGQPEMSCVEGLDAHAGNQLPRNDGNRPKTHEGAISGLADRGED